MYQYRVYYFPLLGYITSWEPVSLFGKLANIGIFWLFQSLLGIFWNLYLYMEFVVYAIGGRFENLCHYLGNNRCVQQRESFISYHCLEYLGICAIVWITYEYPIYGMMFFSAIEWSIFKSVPLSGQHMDACQYRNFLLFPLLLGIPWGV